VFVISENENHSQVCLASGGSRYCLDFIGFFWPKNFNDYKVLAVRVFVENANELWQK
jgi:hypothetical protein